ncbi:MAG: hypothetical protein WAT79_01530 [Saprospiraceae bacterium]
MKINPSKLVIVIVALGFTLLTLSSCNRGTGCPYELKVTTKIINIR